MKILVRYLFINLLKPLLYLLLAFVLGVGQLALAIRFFLCVSDRRARWLLWASLVYLPVLLCSMIAIPLVF